LVAVDINCSIIVKKVLPAFRSYLAKALINKYGYTQTKAASSIGVTQAAISNYVHSKRAKRGYKKLGINYSLVESIANETAEKIVYDKIKPAEITLYFCKFCNSLKASNKILNN
jgi:predicted transcriptional regulator